MRFLTLLSLLLVFFIPTAKSFSSIPVQDCDTIITQKGKTLIVRIISTSKEKVRYQYCGDSTNAPIRFISAKNIKTVKKARVPVVENIVQVMADKDSSAQIISEIPEGAEKVDAAIELKRVTKGSKLAALYTFGAFFLILFAVAFSPFILLLVGPLIIMGLRKSIKMVRATKNRKEFSKQLRLSSLSLVMSILLTILLVAYVLALLISLLILAFIF